MDATFLAKVKADYPEYRFVPGKRFSFRPPKTIVFPQHRDLLDDTTNTKSDIDRSFFPLLLLHEIGHAISQKFIFDTEIERLRIETIAWEEARKLCSRYGVEYDTELVQTELDSYRDWLHQKSRCPECGLTRFQTPDGAWHCPKCDL